MVFDVSDWRRHLILGWTDGTYVMPQELRKWKLLVDWFFFIFLPLCLSDAENSLFSFRRREEISCETFILSYLQSWEMFFKYAAWAAQVCYILFAIAKMEIFSSKGSPSFQKEEAALPLKLKYLKIFSVIKYLRKSTKIYRWIVWSLRKLACLVRKSSLRKVYNEISFCVWIFWNTWLWFH